MPLGIDLQQILLHAFNFIILCAVLYFLLYKPVLSFIKQREDHYRKMDEEAKARLENAQQTEESYREKLGNAEAEIKDLRKNAEGEMRAAKEELLLSAKKEASDILEKARADAGAEKERIVMQAKEDIEKLALEAVDRIVSQKTDEVYKTFLTSLEKDS